MNINQAIEQSHRALADFVKGDPGPVMAMYSRADDVTLANPFGATVRGWDKVSAALTYASSRFQDGSIRNIDAVAMYCADDLASIFEIERWQARVGERGEVSPFELRVSTTWRREAGIWRIVHRHADPIRTFDSSGPLRGR